MRGWGRFCCAFLAFLGSCLAAHAQGTTTYAYTGQSILVPFVHPLPSLDLLLTVGGAGGEGGSSPDYNQDTLEQTGSTPGGMGAYVQATFDLKLQPDTPYYLLITVGGGGGTPQYAYPPNQVTLLCNDSSNLGGFPGAGGGGRGSTYGGCGAGGGGATSVTLVQLLGLTFDFTPLIVAAGGGGAGGPAATPEDFIVGSQGAGGNAGNPADPGADGGQGAAGGCAACEVNQSDANGGVSSLLNLYGGGGGGGGGGATRFGAGGSASDDWGGGGGGAGDSYVNMALNPTDVTITTAGFNDYPGTTNGFAGTSAAYVGVPPSVPEPPTYVLIGLGAAIAGWARFRRRPPAIQPAANPTSRSFRPLPLVS